ncbi:DUF3742 family protein [Neopusillimonas aromaticivorans]|uniref:DUF3742 family protein n=1 Tax=Neopusillimonas aromaticivorans TaxID=2979868 RepID=UPI00259A0095|nr:DUF3742 family protein [Neopusillimonas aromaticivorans]WJJ93287.1 DUF3742 family protein [Neopusillimonas aromaticivorans]
MSTTFRQRFSKAERFGQGLGRVWRWLVRADGKMTAWLMRQGFPQGAAIATLWLTRLAALGVLMYAALWLALLVVFALAAAWAGRNTTLHAEKESQPEWKDGHAGFGMYDKSEWRIDVGSDRPH